MNRLNRKPRRLKNLTTENPNQIIYPTTESEFEIHAALYAQLKRCNVRVRGCVKAICSDGGRNHAVFFDLVVFRSDKTPICIIECKNNQSLSLSPDCRQRRRYSMFGVPLLHCGCMKDVHHSVNQVLILMRQVKEPSKWNKLATQSHAQIA